MKYELTDNTKIHEGYTLYQIVALKDFNDVKKGDLGGYVQTNNNLSQIRTCWIYDNAIARDNARVGDDAKLRNNAIARDNTVIGGLAQLRDNARVSESAQVAEDAIISNYAYISGQALITGYTEVGGRDIINGTARLDMEILK